MEDETLKGTALTPARREAGALITAMQTGALGDLIKPLTREIHLLDLFVSSTAPGTDLGAYRVLQEGDSLTLRREENKFDEFAILILDKEGRKIGYVPEKDDTVLARLMDGGKCLQAKVTSLHRKGMFVQAGIAISMVEF